MHFFFFQHTRETHYLVGTVMGICLKARMCQWANKVRTFSTSRGCADPLVSCEGPRMEPSLKSSYSRSFWSCPLSFWYCPFTSSLHTPGTSTIMGPLGYLNVLNIPPTLFASSASLVQSAPIPVSTLFQNYPQRETSNTHTHSKALVTENNLNWYPFILTGKPRVRQCLAQCQVMEGGIFSLRVCWQGLHWCIKTAHPTTVRTDGSGS